MSEEKLEGSSASEPAHLGTRDQFALSFLWLGLNFQSSAMLPVVVPAQLLLLVSVGQVADAKQATFLAGLGFTAGAISVVVQPLVGMWSDRSRGPARRLGWISGGIALSVLGMGGLTAMASPLLFTMAWVLVQVGANAATAPYQALLPDHVPENQRGAASGWLGLMTLIGSLGSLAAAGVVLGSVQAGPSLASQIRHGAFVFYAAAVATLVVGGVVTHMRFWGAGATARVRPSGDWWVLWAAPLRHRRFRLVFVARSFVMLGLSLFLTFIEYYFARVARVPNFAGATAGVAGLALAGALVSSLYMGAMSDRGRRLEIVIAATLLMALAAFAFVILPAGFPLAPLGVVFGIGYGAYLSVDWALAVDSLPPSAGVGLDMGIWNVASTLPSAVAPLLGGVVIALLAGQGDLAVGYRLTFALAAFTFVGGALALRGLRSRPA